jgi:hypothetical protein
MFIDSAASPFSGAPAERNVLRLMRTLNYTSRSAGANKKLKDSTVYKHSVLRD